jgi:hypothetical protein
MNVQERIQLLVKLGKYMQSSDDNWQNAKLMANSKNGWFIPSFIENACNSIVQNFLQEEVLLSFATSYNIPHHNQNPNLVGVVMAGNIPLVGFHDFLCIFLSGNDCLIKASSKDEVLIKHLVTVLYNWEVTIQNKVSFAQTLKGCDAYIATGSNNSSRYFEYYFSKYPSIIRQNKTSIAILTGTETAENLNALAADIQLYFGQGCRNVTHLFVPKNYNFEGLLAALNQFDYLLDYHKYKNNYDYQLTLILLNQKKYVTNGNILLCEEENIFSPISQINYSYYSKIADVTALAKAKPEVQCIVGNSFTPFGEAQKPSISTYADGVDTMQFLLNL